MKKPIFISAMALIASSFALFASCGEVTTSFASNWFSNTTLSTSISDTDETLTYAVTYENGTNEDVSVSYQNGVYTTNLVNGVYTWEDGATDNVYVYRTSFSIDVTYTIAGESATYHDEITTSATFRTSDNGLKPVSSERKVDAHTVTSSSPVSLKDDVKAYRYTLKTTYDKAVTNATLVFTDLMDNTQKVSEHKINDQYTYLDNEQLLFAIRGMNMGSAEAETVQSLNTARGMIVPIEIKNEAVSTLTPAFTVNGKAVEESITYNQLSVNVSDAQSGVGQTCYYAAPVNQTANTYRNVMILNTVVLPYNMGILTYTLTNANFTTK